MRSCERPLAIFGVLAGAPVSAELLAGYLGSTGEIAGAALVVVFLGPLYGGACLLIREVAARTGRGWATILLLAAVFGLLMPSVVDRSLWTVDHPDVPYWRDAREPTLVAGLPVLQAVQWTIGHVALSIGAPLALLDALAPRLRGRPLLGAVSGSLVLLAMVGIAALVHADGSVPIGPVHPIAGVAVALGLAALVVAAASPLGRPLPTRADRSAPGPGALLGVGFAAMVTFDLVPPTWAGLALTLGGVVALTIAVRRWAGAPEWGVPRVTALACGVLLGRTAIGFLAPLPPGVELAAKLAQSAVLLGAVAGLSALALWRSGRESER